MAPRGKKTQVAKRRRQKGRAEIYGDAGYQLYKDVQLIKELINVETKYIIKDQTVTNAVSTWTVHDCNTDIARGTEYDQRTGATLKGVYVQIRGRISYNPLASPNAQTVRLAVIGKGCVNGSTVNAGSVWVGTPVGNNFVLGWYEPNEMTGYQIMKDKHYTVTADRPDLYFKISRKLNHHAEWNIGDGTGVITNMTKGLISFLYVSDQSSNYPTIEYSTKYKYVDN